MLEVKAVKTNEEIYKAVLEENNFLPNVFSLEGVTNLLSLPIEKVPIILYDIGNSIKDFEEMAYNEAKDYTTEEAREFIIKSRTLRTRLVLLMARSYLHDKFNFPVDYYNNSLTYLSEYLANKNKWSV